MSLFKIYLRLDGGRLDGFEALDFRRKFDLNDDDEIIFRGSGCKAIQVFEVDEGFARSWFGNDMCHTATISAEWLTHGELIDVDHHEVVLADGMSGERAKELYVRHRFDLLKQQAEADGDE